MQISIHRATLSGKALRGSLLLAGMLGACRSSPVSPALSAGPGASVSASSSSPTRIVASDSGERNLSMLRQITFGGENAEAYFSADGQYITFQSTRDGRTCDQQYTMRADGSELRKVSVGGKTTCGWFLPGGNRLFFASTHAADSACPPRPDPSKGYVW
ncbi:MAG TPA: hypothetical protein VE869_00605, partial [Gemmatimonas sp.]|nr:hypothetical protein [Gemmatimonas sp.]